MLYVELKTGRNPWDMASGTLCLSSHAVLLSWEFSSMLESLTSSHKIFPAFPAPHCKPEFGDSGPVPADNQDMVELV